jgi:hypothetical protein
MPETPDFEQIAERIALRTGAFQAPLADVMAELTEQLRQIWNARGAVDLAKVEHELSSMMGSTMAGPYCKNLDRALRALDR